MQKSEAKPGLRVRVARLDEDEVPVCAGSLRAYRLRGQAGTLLEPVKRTDNNVWFVKHYDTSRATYSVGELVQDTPLDENGLARIGINPAMLAALRAADPSATIWKESKPGEFPVLGICQASKSNAAATEDILRHCHYCPEYLYCEWLEGDAGVEYHVRLSFQMGDQVQVIGLLSEDDLPWQVVSSSLLVSNGTPSDITLQDFRILDLPTNTGIIVQDPSCRVKRGKKPRTIALYRTEDTLYQLVLR